MNFFTSKHCVSNVHCKTCRAQTPKGDTFRLDLMNRFDDILQRDFECLHGRAWGFVGLGDMVERIVKPVAQALRLPCYDKGELKPESECAKRRGQLNKLS